ncbi:ribosomal protein L3 glutamine methyltransferase [Andreprevotia lacus DSM 23236]|jgi:ribosomal protein L3 glutamine methyltransferase|uniref:Ribosomal protein uL3 glutamine methyltransferase n=1 Tax=Andreprevotia lacus DSM 23236 TaxID=1121001 RepID=A0A1W1Y1U0_9NEIS|nr:50S ribosomal protein L3 N(5)-glutamine methyltransferase [Andreprevotia lacus]SMC29761.1 ribosomal protein L3 glutamine methyltransferase [Andreprevotia lacus DSM 23236]
MYDIAQQQLVTLRDCLRFAVSRFGEAELFYGHGTDNAFDEAAYLLLSLLKLPIDQLEPFLDARLLDEERAAVVEAIRRRAEEHVPVAYLTHEAWLGEYKFFVDERTIVPRSFIAELLFNDALEPWIEHPELVNRALDLCTGSGCLAILLAEHYPAAEVDAVDLSPDALDVAEINVADYNLGERIDLIDGDLLEPLAGETYDLIVSNPPYVDAPSMEELPMEYRHEPQMALGSGVDGLDITRRIIEKATTFLNPNGVLVVEIGHNRDVLEADYPELPFVWLDTASGDGFVFLLTREMLEEAGF